ncbi:MAG: HD domain-containing protein [Bdellovibrionales bacterium]|nr:HD domain-containing protein [Bdellovibrionales bacterium]
MTARNIKILVAFRDDSVRAIVVQNLRFRIKDSRDIHEMRSIEDAIEHLEAGREEYGLIVFESRGHSRTLVRAMIELAKNAAVIVCGSDEQVLSDYKGSDVPVVFLPLDLVGDRLSKTVKALETSGKIPLFHENESEYLGIRANLLPTLGVLQANVFMLILDGRYVPILKKGDLVNMDDIRHFIEKVPDQVFYFRRDECGDLLQSKIKRLESALEEIPIDSEKVEDVIAESFGIVRDVVSQIGFTPEAQRVAVNSVMLTIKLLGANPKLRSILNDLKEKEGGYIPSHSIYLGKVACALAHKVGWRSQSTYFKLTLAAFLHDISLKDERMAKVFDLEHFEKSGNGEPEEVREIRIHPARSAEYARQFQEIPSEVEQIVAQHHERPDGSGFPRGLVVRYFTPLSALFVIAQDLIEYSNSTSELSFDAFFEKKEMEYNVGIFRKLARALRTDTTLV